MDSWMDQGCQQFQFPPQSSKPTAWQRDTMGNLQAGSVGPSHQYWTSNAGAQPPQSYQYPSSDWQARATSCKQIPTGQHNPNHWGVNGHFQSGNPQSTASVGAQQGFPQNCPQSSAAQGPTSIGLYQQVTPGSTYTTAANSLPHGHWSDTLAYNTHNLNHRQNSSQDRSFSSVCPPPEYFSAVNQSYRKMTTKSSSSQQAVSRSQRAQPHHAPVSRGQYNTSSCSRADRLPEHTSDRTSGRVITKIAENQCKSVSSAHPARYYGKQYVSHSQNQSQNQNQNQSQNRNQNQNQNQSQNQNWSQNQSQVRGSELNHHTQVAGNDSHTFQSVPLCSTQSSPKTTLSRAAKRSKAPETKTKDSYQSPDQPSRYASQPEYSSPVFTAMFKGVSTGGSVDWSPGCVGTRAVAVVQPLLQESCHQGARHNTSPDMTKQPPEPAATYELPRRKSQEFRKSPKKSKQTTSEECETSDPLGSADPLLDPAADLTQNQPTGPEPAAADIQDHQNVSPALSEPAAEAPESVVELSSVPAIPHTPGMMMKLIQELNEDNMNHIRKSSHCSTASKLMDMFWDGDLKIFVTYLKKKVFSQIGYEADAFCREHVTKDTVIMSGVKEDDWKAVKGHRILKHDEVYTEPPYRPFWLIDNEKLDDIEKEFGLPWPLRRRLHTMESDIQRDQGDSISEEILRDVSETVLALTEQEQVDLSGRKSSCSDETTSTKSATSEESSDPYGALEIKVLPPEEALLIFEQAVMGTAAQSGSQASCSAEAKLLEVVNLTLRDLEQEGTAISPVDQVSCLEEYQSAKDPLKDARTCEEEGQLENDKMHGISSDCMSNPTEGEDPDPTEREHPDPMEGEHPDPTEREHPDPMEGEHPDPMEGEHPDPMEGEHSDPTEREHPDHTEGEHPDLIEGEHPDLIEGEHPDLIEGEHPDLIEGEHPARVGDSCNTQAIIYMETVDSLDNRDTDSFQEVLNSSQFNDTHTSLQAVQRKQEGLQDYVGSPNRSVKPLVQDAPSEKQKELAGVIESKYSSFKCRTVKLALFGSSQQAQYSTVGKMSHVFASEAMSTRPPEVLSVSLSPLKRKINKAVPSEELSPVKLRIYENWRKSLPPTQIRYKKFKSQKFLSLSSASPKKSDRTGRLKQPLYPEKRIYDVKVISGRGRLASNELKHRKEKRGRRRHAEKLTDQPHQDNIILKFSVLPETFSFRDEPHNTESTTDPAPNTTEHAERKHSNKSDIREKGTWSKHSEKKYRPLMGKTSSIFQEFKKKYKKLSQQE
ncbi:uncharacterized protein LOC141796032 [Halichoeres trimaculatus]|uniref:uncharacterized protein LOC141796032 n=1 Tax=Halichoeres trimaculatus TaxID=147232 RepID=UPI003D9E4C3B